MARTNSILERFLHSHSKHFHHSRFAGGTNPAMRTFFYRLLRLMKLSVHPLFVFDGPNKPSEKRNKKTGQTFASIPEYFAKQVLKKFGFPFHDAPGEAEAECALLQRSGIVDMVMSEDVDTIMFGSRNTIRPAQDPKSAKSATHFNLYDSDEIKAGSSGLDREGMILVAMMSGGDYLTEGIPGCGPKVACEAARAGFGKKLCELSPGDKRGLEEWKLELAEELRTNQSKYFKTKHAGLVLPEDFPRMKILKYYTHPAISSAAAIDRLRARISWDQEIHLAGVREITREVFKWQGKTGAKHFIRNLAPALLPRQLRLRGQRVAAEMSSQKTTAELEEEEGQLVVSIHGQRQHLSTDHMDELRVAIVPSKIVPIDMDAEDEDNEESLVDIEADLASAETPEEGEGSTKRPNQYDPDQPERHWVMDSFLKCGVPIKVEDWQETQRKKNAPKEKKPRKEKAKKPPAGKGGMPMGALDKFTTVTKSNAGPSGKPTRPKSPSVDRLDLPTEPTASMPDFVDLCSSPAV
ncbi:PIN domain-like protein, partial [Phyllosticta citribraziliensis]